MTIPNLPAFWDMDYTDANTGKLSPDGYIFNDQTFQTLNAIVILLNAIVNSTINQAAANNVVINGINPPPYTTAEIIALEPDVPDGTIWFNTTLKKLQVKTDTGVIETITSV